MEEDDGTWDFYETSGTCGSVDAEITWSFSVPADTDFIQFSPENIEYIDYYAYQVDGGCDFDGVACDDYYDAFEMSLLGVDGGTYSTGGGWTLYGPRAVGYINAAVMETSIAYWGTLCQYPDSEYSVWEGISNVAPITGLPAVEAYFLAFFYPPPILGLGYAGRYTQEDITITGENCYTQFGGMYGPITSIANSTFGPIILSSYGPDYIGALKDSVDYYQSQMGPYDICSQFSGTQAMKMNHCEAPSVFSQYDPGHRFQFVITQTGATSYRGDASGPAE